MTFKALLARLQALWRSEHIHDEIDEELRFHIDLRSEENVRSGMQPEEARRQAEHSFGHFTRIRESGYDVRGGGWLEALSQDLRFSLRTLLNNRGFTLIAIVTLGTGIAASTTILSVANPVLSPPLPFPDSDRLVVLFATTPERGIYRDTTSFPDFTDWKTQSQSLTEAAAYRTDPFNVAGGAAAAERVDGLRASHELFRVLGTNPAMGRTFDEQEQVEARPVALISHGMWVGRFGDDPDVLDLDILLNDVSHSIIGVLPEGFQFPPFSDTDVLVPVQEYSSRSRGYIRGIARLEPGVSVATAQSELDAVAQRLEQAFPLANEGRGVNVVPLGEVAVGAVSTPLLVLLGAAMFLLLIGCANVGGLVLARGIARRRELAMRRALGAGAGRLVRQLLTESIVLALLAGLCGTILAVLGSRMLVVSLAERFTLPDITFEWSLLAISIGITLFAGVACGLPPALIVGNSDLNNSLRQGESSQSAGPKQYRLRSLLVISQAALTIMLLVGAGLLLNSFLLLHRIDTGLDPRNVLTANLVLSNRYENPDSRQTFLGDLLGSVGGLPGIQQVAVLTDLPLEAGAQETFSVEGHADPGPRQGHVAGFNVISSDFFRALNIPIELGRSFDQRDDARGVPVAIVNETMVRQFWPDDNPIGKQIRLYYDEDQERWLSVVGVAGDVRNRGRDVDLRPQVLVPYQQVQSEQSPFVWLVARTDADPSSLSAGLRARIQAIDQDQPVSNIRTMEQVLSGTVADRRLYLSLLSSFALIALIMATAGIYSLMSYVAASRTHEMGIRVALGATRGHVVALALRGGVLLMAIGVSIGIAGSLVLTEVLASFLFGIAPTDPPTFAVMTLLFAAVGAVAMYIPARRAAMIDPTLAFRCE